MELDFYIKRADSFGEDKESSQLGCENGFCSLTPPKTKYSVKTLEDLKVAIGILITAYGEETEVKSRELVNSDYSDSESFTDLTLEVIKDPTIEDKYIIIIE